jgi:prepilin-type N-terminal cleavage/methylation domain-containing protein
MLLRTKNNQKDRGVSFIELLVAVVILALTITGLINLFDASKRWIEHSQSRMAVGEIAKLILDPLQRQVRQDQWGIAALNCLSTDTCADTTIPLQGKNYDVVYTIDNEQPIANLNRVRININWDEPHF